MLGAEGLSENPGKKTDGPSGTGPGTETDTSSAVANNGTAQDGATGVAGLIDGTYYVYPVVFILEFTSVDFLSSVKSFVLRVVHYFQSFTLLVA